MDATECAAALETLAVKLAWLADQAYKTWNIEYARWMQGDNEIDLADTLASTYEEVGLRQAARWVEINLESGPQRRERLLSVLGWLADEAREIRGDKRRWTKRTINFAAAKLAAEMRQASEYLWDLAEVVQRQANPDALAEPLTERQQEALDYIRANQPVTGKQIATALGAEESTVTGHLIPALKKLRGVKNRRGAGYYLT